jgi:hypothetical protein
MPDPRLVSRAQRAATTLERAWDRWRAVHGLAAEPLPPVSSYVGYSIEQPWGRPRVVFGVDAADAEKLAAFLQKCTGSSPAAGPAGPGAAVPAAELPQPDRASPQVGGKASDCTDSDRSIADSMAAELAGWAAGELPGQASARLAAWATAGTATPRGGREADLRAGGAPTGPVI